MPPLPEISGIEGKIWQDKVDHQFKTHQSGKSTSNIRVSTKITIDLNCKCEGSYQDIQSTRIAPRLKDLVGDDRHIIRNNKLLEVSPEDQRESCCELIGIDPALLVDLRKQFSRFIDRTCK